MARRRRERMSEGKKNIIAGLRKRLRAYAGCYGKMARQISECNETPGRKLGCALPAKIDCALPAKIDTK